MSEHIDKALVHFESKLAEERKRFGVLGASVAFVQHNAQKVADAGDLWGDLSRQIDLFIQIETVDGQTVFGVVSKSEIPGIMSFYKLWNIVQQLNSGKSDAEKIENVVYYDGPYRFKMEHTNTIKEAPADLYADFRASDVLLLMSECADHVVYGEGVNDSDMMASVEAGIELVKKLEDVRKIKTCQDAEIYRFKWGANQILFVGNVNGLRALFRNNPQSRMNEL